MDAAKYVLNTKNGRVFPNGPQFKKMKGLIPITEEMYQKILKREVTAGEIIGKAASVVEPVGAVHIDKKPDVAKADDGAGDDTPEASINIEAEIAERLKQEVDEEAKAAKDAGTAEGLSRENVTIADVIATPDADIHAFSRNVLSMNMPEDRPASFVREKVMKIVSKVEQKRNSREKKVLEPGASIDGE